MRGRKPVSLNPGHLGQSVVYDAGMLPKPRQQGEGIIHPRGRKG